MVYTLHQYAYRLGTAEVRVQKAVKQVITRGALNIRDDWRLRATRANPRHAPKYASTIVMRRVVVTAGGEITAVVEPGQWGQGRLGQVLEYGHGATKNQPQMSHVEALTKEAPALMHWLGQVSADAIR